MSSLLLIYGGIGALALVCIILAIVNWVYLAAVSSRMTELDVEVTKKTTQFDALRKELHHAPAVAERETGAAPRVADLPPPAPEEPGQIQIFRNVREEYPPDAGPYVAVRPSENAVAPVQESAAYTHVEAASPEDTRMEQVSLDGEAVPHTPGTAEFAPSGPLPEPPPVPEPSPGPGTPPPPEMEGDVMDVVSSDEELPPARAQAPAASDVALPLYSPAKKDADFLATWKALAQRLPQQPGRRVFLDFNNILFVYDEEIHYLEQMVAMAAKFEAQLLFVNCTTDVARAVGMQPRLAACLAAP